MPRLLTLRATTHLPLLMCNFTKCRGPWVLMDIKDIVVPKEFKGFKAHEDPLDQSYRYINWGRGGRT